MPSKVRTKDVLEGIRIAPRKNQAALHANNAEQIQFLYDKEVMLDQLDRQTIIALKSQLENIDAQCLLQFKEFEIRELKLRLLKKEHLFSSQDEAKKNELAVPSQESDIGTSPSVPVTIGSSKKSRVQRMQQSSLFEALSPAYDRKPEKSSKAKGDDVGSASINKRISSESNGQKKKARASTSDIPDTSDLEKEQMQKLRRRTTTPGKFQKSERTSIGSSSSKKNVKSKPKFASKPSGTSQQNPFAVFDMTRRLSAPKLKTIV